MLPNAKTDLLTKRLIDVILKDEPDFCEYLQRRITRSLGVNIHDRFTDILAQRDLKEARATFRLYASLEHLIVKAFISMPNAVLHHDGIEIKNAPETAVLKHKEKLAQGLKARDIIDTHLVDDIMVKAITIDDFSEQPLYQFEDKWRALS